jgi:hypothetical protein
MGKFTEVFVWRNEYPAPRSLFSCGNQVRRVVPVHNVPADFRSHRSAQKNGTGILACVAACEVSGEETFRRKFPQEENGGTPDGCDGQQQVTHRSHLQRRPGGGKTLQNN